MAPARPATSKALPEISPAASPSLVSGGSTPPSSACPSAILWVGPLPLDPDGPTPTHGHPQAVAGLGLRPWFTLGEVVACTMPHGSYNWRACCPCDEEHGRACSEPWRLDRPTPTVTTAEENGTRANAVAGWVFNGGPDWASDAASLIGGIHRIELDESRRLQNLSADWPLPGTVHQR